MTVIKNSWNKWISQFLPWKNNECLKKLFDCHSAVQQKSIHAITSLHWTYPRFHSDPAFNEISSYLFIVPGKSADRQRANPACPDRIKFPGDAVIVFTFFFYLFLFFREISLCLIRCVTGAPGQTDMQKHAANK